MALWPYRDYYLITFFSFYTYHYSCIPLIYTLVVCNWRCELCGKLPNPETPYMQSQAPYDEILPYLMVAAQWPQSPTPL